MNIGCYFFQWPYHHRYALRMSPLTHTSRREEPYGSRADMPRGVGCESPLHCYYCYTAWSVAFPAHWFFTSDRRSRRKPKNIRLLDGCKPLGLLPSSSINFASKKVGQARHAAGVYYPYPWSCCMSLRNRLSAPPHRLHGARRTFIFSKLLHGNVAAIGVTAVGSIICAAISTYRNKTDLQQHTDIGH